MVCQAWDKGRSELLDKLDLTPRTFALKTMAEAMVGSREGWMAVQTFVERVMFEKEEYERGLNREPRDSDDSDDESAE